MENIMEICKELVEKYSVEVRPNNVVVSLDCRVRGTVPGNILQLARGHWSYNDGTWSFWFSDKLYETKNRELVIRLVDAGIISGKAGDHPVIYCIGAWPVQQEEREKLLDGAPLEVYEAMRQRRIALGL